MSVSAITKGGQALAGTLGEALDLKIKASSIFPQGAYELSSSNIRMYLNGSKE